MHLFFRAPFACWFFAGMLLFLEAQLLGQTEMTEHIKKLGNTPGWGQRDQARDNRPRSEQLVEVILSIIDGRSPQEVRTFVEGYVEYAAKIQSDSSLEWSKLFILNRIYFDVPKWDSVQGIAHRGGFLPLPRDGDKYGVLFPLEREKDGTIHLVHGGFSYFGAPYNALAEFDLFNQRYGTRK